MSYEQSIAEALHELVEVQKIANDNLDKRLKELERKLSEINNNLSIMKNHFIHFVNNR